MIYLEMKTQITNSDEKEADKFASDFLIIAKIFDSIIQHSLNK